MILLAWAVVGGLVWMGLRGQADPATFCVGVIVAVVVGGLSGLPRGGVRSPARLALGVGLLVRLGLHFLADLITANLRQLRLVLAPRMRVRPRWVRFDTVLERRSTRTLLGVLISLTPGTVTAELDEKEFLIHVLDAAPDEYPVTRIRERFETLLSKLEAL